MGTDSDSHGGGQDSKRRSTFRIVARIIVAVIAGLIAMQGALYLWDMLEDRGVIPRDL